MPWSILGSIVGGLLPQAAISALQDWASKKSQGRRLAESSGIYDSLVGKKLNELRVHNSDRDDSEFLPRDAQKKLIQNIKDRTPTLIVGPSMSGKTRLVVETVRKNYPSTPVWFPKGDDDIQRLVDAAQGPRRGSIIILDDVDRFLSNQTLSLGQLNAWIREPCIVIATMMRSSYIPWRDGAKDKLPGWDVVNRFTLLQMNASLTEDEKVALLSSSYANLAAAVEKVGLTPLLGGAPKVRQRLEEGREQHLWGYALVRAAADWRRVGLGPATKTQIQEVALVFKDTIAWDDPDWEEAWAWASQELNDTVSLIRQTGSREWEVLDLVADEADWPLSQQTLEAMAGTEHSPRQAFAIFLTMYTGRTLDNENPIAKQILQETDEFLYKITTESTPNSNLFDLYAFFLTDVRHDYDRAQNMYERAIEADSTNANSLSNYAIFLTDVRHDYDRSESMFERAITADPNHANSLGNYALFLRTIRHDYDRAQNMYERAIEADPNHTDSLGNYANLMWTIRHDYDRAQNMYERAIEADPTNANSLSNYANLLRTIRHDYDRAQNMYERAIEADPNHANSLSNYASFLTDVRHDYDRAQNMYERAIEADPTNANSLSNYANLFGAIRHDYDRAQNMYERAIEADPNHTDSLGNYASFMWTIRHDYNQAETMFERAITIDPNHTNNLGNYASFMWTIRHDYNQAETMFERAITADPTNAHILGTYAFFIETIRGDHDRAESMFERAITADPTNANILGTYALFLKTVRGDSNRAQAMYERAIEADPNHANTLGNYSQFLFATGQDKTAIVLVTRALSLADTDEKPLVAECRFYLFAHSPEHRRESGENLRNLLAAGVTTGSWSFEPNLERLRREKDPRYDLVRDVADALSSGDTRTLEARGEWYTL